jgi:SAM-dependent methyltransferase
MKQKREIVERSLKMYHKSSKREKGEILTELSQITGYNRKYLTYLLNNRIRTIALYKLSERYDCYWRGIDPFSLEKKDNKIQILNISAEDIDSLKENYDIIFSIRSFHHIKNINEFIKGLRKKLKKNGVFILVDWKKGYDTGISEKYFSLYEIKNLFSESDFFIIESGEKETVFYIIIKSLL